MDEVLTLIIIIVIIGLVVFFVLVKLNVIKSTTPVIGRLVSRFSKSTIGEDVTKPSSPKEKIDTKIIKTNNMIVFEEPEAGADSGNVRVERFEQLYIRLIANGEREYNIKITGSTQIYSDVISVPQNTKIYDLDNIIEINADPRLIGNIPYGYNKVYLKYSFVFREYEDGRIKVVLSFCTNVYSSTCLGG